MNPSLVIHRARHYRTGRPVEIRPGPDHVPLLVPAAHAPDDLWIAPALVDLQVNGYAGIDFQQENLSTRDLETAAQSLHRDGCHRFFATLITAAWPALLQRLRTLKHLRNASPLLRRAIAGWHIEGPFLSQQPGFHGAHEPALMSDPHPDRMEELRTAAGDDPVLLTIAPERNGAIDTIRRAQALDITVSLGHSDATSNELAAAVQAGARAFTHLGNGCPRDLDRHDNILWRVMEQSGLVASLIPDRIHLSPALFRILHRQLGPDRIYYTTDAMSAAGAGPGSYTIGAVQVDVGEDQVVRQPGRTNFAGSALQPLDGIRRAAAMLGCSWREVWDFFSVRPAALGGLPAGLDHPEPAGFVLVRARGDSISLEAV